MKTLKCTGPGMEPCGTPLVADHEPDVIPFTVTHCALPMSQLLCLWWCVYSAELWTFCPGHYERQHWWLRKSKKMITSTVFPWSMRWRILPWMGVRRIFPSWTHAGLWMMTVLSFRYFSITHRIIFSIIFPGTEARLTGGSLPGSFLLPFFENWDVCQLSVLRPSIDSMFLCLCGDRNIYKGFAAVILLALSCINHFPSSPTHIKDKSPHFQF